MLLNSQTGINYFYTGRHLFEAADNYYTDQQQYEESNIIDRAKNLAVLRGARQGVRKLWGRTNERFLSKETFIPHDLRGGKMFKGGKTSFGSRLFLGYALFGMDTPSDLAANVGLQIGMQLMESKHSSYISGDLARRNIKSGMARKEAVAGAMRYESNYQGLARRIKNSSAFSFLKEKGIVLPSDIQEATPTSPLKSEEAIRRINTKTIYNPIYKTTKVTNGERITPGTVKGRNRPVRGMNEQVTSVRATSRALRKKVESRRWGRDVTTIESVKTHDRFIKTRETRAGQGGRYSSTSREVSNVKFKTKSPMVIDYMEEKLAKLNSHGERVALLKEYQEGDRMWLGIKAFGKSRALPGVKYAAKAGATAGLLGITAGYFAAPAIKAGFDTFNRGLTAAIAASQLDFGSGFVELPGEANSERERALGRIRDASMNARNHFGSEGSMYH
jgi:hypothetical protein